MANKTQKNYTLANAFTNNTFSLEDMHKQLHRSVSNSFQYLKSLQSSYVDIHRYTLHNDDFHVDGYGVRSITIPRDIIDANKRRKYKNSDYYDRDITYDEMLEKSELFKYVPFILIDDCCYFDFTIHTYIDEKFDIFFPSLNKIVDFFLEDHEFKVILIKSPTIYDFDTNWNVITRYGYAIPPSVTGIEGMDSSSVVFFTVRRTTDILNFELRVAHFDDDSNFIIDTEDTALTNYLISGGTFSFRVMQFRHMKLFRTGISIHKDVTTEKEVVVAAIDSGQNDGTPYPMPIPTESLWVIRRNIDTHAIRLENALDINLRYPNIYEVDVDGLIPEPDQNSVVFDVYYFYVESVQRLRYVNRMLYLYKYFMEKYELGYQETIEKLYSDEEVEEPIRDFFNYMLAYEEANFVYSSNDFMASELYPYDYDYKIAKFKEFVGMNNDVLKDYAESMKLPFENYYIDMYTVDLSERERNDTRTEAKDPANWKDFTSPCYVFSFRNETDSSFQVRFYADGLLIREAFRFNEDGMEYIYFYTTEISQETFLEMEVFRKYNSVVKLNFENTEELLDAEFLKKDFVIPNFYNLMIADEDGNTVSYDQIRLYLEVDPAKYDTADKKGEDIIDKDYIIKEGDKYYLDTYPTYAQAEQPEHVDDDEKLSTQFMELTSAKVKLLDSSLIGKDIYLTMDSAAVIRLDTMMTPGVPKLKLFEAGAAWSGDESYIRTYINGRLTVIPYELSEEEDGLYFIPKAYIDEGEQITIDVTPHSYTLEYEQERIDTDDFVVDFGTELTKPFSLKYYDAYLNGKKLTANNIQILSPTKIRLVNTHSDFRLKIYRKDRDVEYFYLPEITEVPLDYFLDSTEIPDEDKKELLESIVSKNFDHYTDPDISEGDHEDKYEMSEAEVQFHDFYLTVIIPEGICRPRDFLISVDELVERYTYVYDNYATEERLVIRPNFNAETAKYVLIVGKNNTSMIGKLARVKKLVGEGQEASLGNLGFTNVIDAITTFYDRIDWVVMHILEDRSVAVTQRFPDEE